MALIAGYEYQGRWTGPFGGPDAHPEGGFYEPPRLRPPPPVPGSVPPGLPDTAEARAHEAIARGKEKARAQARARLRAKLGPQPRLESDPKGWARALGFGRGKAQVPKGAPGCTMSQKFARWLGAHPVCR